MENPRFRRKLTEQLGHIRASCDGFDRGDESEAIRIAAALRILFHQTRNSTALLKHLGMMECEMLGANQGLQNVHGYVRIKLNFSSATPVTAAPRLGTAFAILPLRDWWRFQVVFEFGGKRYMRQHLVLSAANKDGGAHVDADLEPFYLHLASGLASIQLDAAKMVFSGRPPPFDTSKVQSCPNIHVAMIRQFGHEVLATAEHFKWVPASVL